MQSPTLTVFQELSIYYSSIFIWTPTANFLKMTHNIKIKDIYSSSRPGKAIPPAKTTRTASTSIINHILIKRESEKEGHYPENTLVLQKSDSTKIVSALPTSPYRIWKIPDSTSKPPSTALTCPPSGPTTASWGGVAKWLKNNKALERKEYFSHTETVFLEADWGLGRKGKGLNKQDWGEIERFEYHWWGAWITRGLVVCSQTQNSQVRLKLNKYRIGGRQLVSPRSKAHHYPPNLSDPWYFCP